VRGQQGTLAAKGEEDGLRGAEAEEPGNVTAEAGGRGGFIRIQRYYRGTPENITAEA